MITDLHDDAAALDVLLEAEEVSPDETRTHRHTRAVVRQLLTRRHAGPEVRALADRCAVSA